MPKTATTKSTTQGARAARTRAEVQEEFAQIEHAVADFRTRQHQLESELSASVAARAEQEREIAKQRAREEEEYEYKNAQQRKKAQDDFGEKMQKLTKQNQERQAALEKGWQEREAEIKSREDEHAALGAAVEQFSARLKNEVDAAVKTAVDDARAQHGVQLQLATKESESERKLAALQIKTLEEVRQIARDQAKRESR